MSFCGEIRLLPQNRIPKGWMPCDGQLLQVKDYQALASLLGHLYGGDGFFNFALPDLRGRVAMGLDGANPGHTGGDTTHGLNDDEMPKHNHPVAAGNVANRNTPKGNYPGMGSAILSGGGPKLPLYHDQWDTLSGYLLTPVGEFVPHENMMPSLVMVYCICVDGEYPMPG